MKQILDVSMLEPCEPMEQTLKAIQVLESGDFLQVIHRREPNLLYPLLEKAGFAWHCQQGGPAGYEIYIWRNGDADAEAEARCAF